MINLYELFIIEWIPIVTKIYHSLLNFIYFRVYHLNLEYDKIIIVKNAKYWGRSDFFIKLLKIYLLFFKNT